MQSKTDSVNGNIVLKSAFLVLNLILYFLSRSSILFCSNLSVRRENALKAVFIVLFLEDLKT